MISHLGAMCGPVLGATDSQRRFGRKAVGFSFFGDGASSTGDVHEAMNNWLRSCRSRSSSSSKIMAMPTRRRQASNSQRETGTSGSAAGYGMEGIVIECGDPGATAKILDGVISKVRATSRPVLVESRTLRLRGHAAYDTCDYLLPGEAAAFAAKDPLGSFRSSVAATSGAARVDALDAEIVTFVEACVQVCIAVPRPGAEGMEEGLFAPAPKAFPWKPEPKEPESVTMAQALNHAIRKVLVERPERRASTRTSPPTGAQPR